jgi:hypothetical protein
MAGTYLSRCEDNFIVEDTKIIGFPPPGDTGRQDAQCPWILQPAWHEQLYIWRDLGQAGTGSMLQSILCCQISFLSVNNCIIYNHYFVVSFEWITLYSLGKRRESICKSDLANLVSDVYSGDVLFATRLGHPTILTEVFCEFLQFFQANTGMVPQIITRPFPWTPFPLFTLSFDIIESVLTASLTKP